MVGSTNAADIMVANLKLNLGYLLIRKYHSFFSIFCLLSAFWNKKEAHEITFLSVCPQPHCYVNMFLKYKRRTVGCGVSYAVHVLSNT
jgi:hypothetical protein